MAIQQANKAVADATRTVKGTAETPPLLSRITGIDEGLRAEFTLRVLRPILYLVLIGFLIIVEGSAALFQERHVWLDLFSDYFGLLVWAMSSDVASRTAGLSEALIVKLERHGELQWHGKYGLLHSRRLKSQDNGIVPFINDIL
jgi:hypothetical protein